MPRSGQNADANWRLEFIHPAKPGDPRCVMLYGLGGEIVGPLTMELAEAWMDRFDNRPANRVSANRKHGAAAAAN